MGWLAAQSFENLFTTAITLGEVGIGVAALPPSRRRADLERAIEAVLAGLFGGRILSFDEPAGRALGPLVQARRRQGLGIGIVDAQIAAIALVHGASVATRDLGGFEDAGVPVINPWDHAP